MENGLGKYIDYPQQAQRPAFKPTIRFSEDYHKLPEGILPEGEAKLVLVQRVPLEAQTSAFIEVDTAYRKGGHYPLPARGDYFLLGFVTAKGCFFSTFRAYSEAKEKFFRRNLYKWWKVELAKTSE